MAGLLLIEPDKLLAANTAAYFKRQQYRVRIAPDAQAAILAADRARPDLVILELLLGAHSGLEFLYEFRSYPEWHSIPVLVLSDVAAEELAAYAATWDQLGVVAALNKAQTPLPHLAESIERALAAVPAWAT